MPASIAPNPDLALWIAGIGFLSSLAVVLINAMVTVASKRIDARLKKDEQAYGYRMEYLRRKLNAGEKAIGKLNLQIRTLAWFSKHYDTLLKAGYLDEPGQIATRKEFERIYYKYQDANFDKDDSYHAYFSTDTNSYEPSNIIIRCESLNVDISEILREFYIMVDAVKTEQNQEKNDAYAKTVYLLYKDAEESMREYIQLNDIARTESLKFIDKIRNEIESDTVPQ